MQNPINKLAQKAKDEIKAKIRNKIIAAVLQAMVAILAFVLTNLIWIVLAIVGLVIITWVVGVFEDVYDDLVNTETVRSVEAQYTSNEMLDEMNTTAFYTKYSEQSYYYFLLEPTEEEREDAKKYSDSTYEELGGLEEQGLTQASNENYVEDIDGYEEVVSLSYSKLALLDRYLNGAGDTGYYNPEQFLKLPYFGESCTVTSEDFNVDKWGCVTTAGTTKEVTCEVNSRGELTTESKNKNCTMGDDYKSGKESWTETVTLEKDLTEKLKLGDITEAESTKYEEDIDGKLTATEEKEVSTADYGLASVVRFKAYLQPSRVTNYKLKNVTYVLEDWDFDSGSSENTPIINRTWSSLTDEEKEYILSEFKYGNNKGSSTQGLVTTNETGIYDVEDEIVYKEWAPAFEKITSTTDYTGLDWDKWAASDPGISTGVYETTIAYAIDKAMTFAGDLNLKVSYKWNDLGESTHTQTGTYVKDYTTSEHGKDFEEYTIPEGSLYTGYKKVYVSGKFVGYALASEKFEWHEGKLTTDINGESRDKATTTKKSEKSCEAEWAALTTNSSGIAKNAWMENCTQIDVPTTKKEKWYEITYEPGYWTIHLVKDTNWNGTDQDYEIGKEDAKSESGWESEGGSSKYNNIKNEYKSENKKDDKYVWNYTPTYEFKISAYTSGTFQMKLVSHTSSLNTSVDVNETYFNDYLENYKSYINNQTSTIFACYSTSGATTDADGNWTEDSIESMTINSEVSDSGNVNIKMGTDCSDTDFMLATSSSTGNMTAFNYNEQTELQKTKLKSVLKLNFNNDDENDIAITDDKIEVPETFTSDLGIALTKTNADYKNEIKKAEARYGVDKNLLILMLYTTKDNSKFGGLHCDATDGCSLGTVDIFDNAKDGYNETKTISTATKALSIYSMAAKMQTLLKRYDGNLLLALLDYNVGREATDKILEVYEKDMGIPKEETISNQNDTTWYHYVNEVISNPDKYGISVNEGAYSTFVGDVINNMRYTNFFWRYRKENNDVVTKIWKRYGLEDRLTNAFDSSEQATNKVRMLYSLKKDNSENLKKYWNLISNGQKSWNSGVYLDNGTYTLPTYSNAIEIEPDITDISMRDIKLRVLTTGTNLSVQEARKLTDVQILRQIGSSNKLTIAANYRTLLGKIQAPADTYTTNKEKSALAGSVYAYKWVINTDEDAEIYSITQGIVSGVGNSVVRVVYEKKNLEVVYSGLKDIEVEKDDEVKSKTIGKSTGEVTIWLYIDGENYDMKQFVDQMQAQKNASSSAFMGLFTGSFGSFAGKVIENPEDLWAIISQYSTISGADINDTQCTTFTNFMMQSYWGIENEAINGNGNAKVERIKEVLGDRVTEITNNLEDFGDQQTNIAFSWDDGDCGHTGWINEYNRDEGYVIVSQGNINGGGIQWKYKYSLEEWESTLGENVQYIAWEGEDMADKTDEEVWYDTEIIAPYEIGESE